MTITLRPCGTWAAYKRHLGAGEKPCPSCVEASRARDRARYHANADYRRRVNDRSIRNARRRAEPVVAPEPRLATCRWCLDNFDTRSAGRTYCSEKCRNSAKWRRRSSRSGLPREVTAVWVALEGGIPQRVGAETRALTGGGMFIWCPSCGALAGIVDQVAYQTRGARWCHACRLHIAPAG